jgi:AcrR family transcriptional regulator
MTHPNAAQRRERGRAAARRSILSATEAILDEAGHDGLSVRKLVERCGYSAPTIYQHFGDKPGLIDALLEERLQELVAELERVTRSADPVENLRAQCVAFARFGIENPTHYALLMNHRPLDAPPLPAGEEARAILERPLTALAEQGRILHENTELVRQSIWACLHGLIALPASRRDLDWQPALLESSLDALIRGWISPAPGRHNGART